MSDGMEKIVSPLRKAMSELDYAIPDYVFDSEDGHKIHDLIQKVWDEIDKFEYGEDEDELEEVNNES
tara:strand:- start:196 stop:396 length:201 start_codon:yes stop_codon:yes gene_type:complete